jgi:hypothetical protein
VGQGGQRWGTVSCESPPGLTEPNPLSARVTRVGEERRLDARLQPAAAVAEPPGRGEPIPGPVVRVASQRQAIALYEEIIRPDRRHPIVGLTCRAGKHDPALPVDRVRERVWPTVPIYVIEPRESRTLNGLLAEGLAAGDFGAYNGAARVWWPGVDADAHPSWHPLIYDPTREYGDGALERLAVEFTMIPDSAQHLALREQTALRLRSVPRPQELPQPPIGKFTPTATRKDLRRLTSELRGGGGSVIVVLTPAPDDEQPTVFTPSAVRAAVDPLIPIYLLGNSDLCRRLAHALGDDLAVHGGDARVYWPPVRDDSDPAAHPLVAAESAAEHPHPAELIVSALDLSRPQVRGRLTATIERLHRVEQQATGTLHDLREARADLAAERRRADDARRELQVARVQLDAITASGLDHAELQLITALDLDGRLRRLINREWLKALSGATERDEHPLRYVFGPGFVKSVDGLTGIPVERIAWVSAMVACGRARAMYGVEPRALRAGRTGSGSQTVRADGARAWVCKLKPDGTSHLHYWVRADGIPELASVTHGAIGHGV